MSEERTVPAFERLCRNHAKRAYYNHASDEVRAEHSADEYADRRWPLWASAVQDDLAELREPDVTMAEAGAKVMFDDEVGELERRIFTDAWRAAIDAISGGEG